MVATFVSIELLKHSRIFPDEVDCVENAYSAEKAFSYSVLENS